MMFDTADGDVPCGGGGGGVGWGARLQRTPRSSLSLIRRTAATHQGGSVQETLSGNEKLRRSHEGERTGKNPAGLICGGSFSPVLIFLSFASSFFFMKTLINVING